MIGRKAFITALGALALVGAGCGDDEESGGGGGGSTATPEATQAAAAEPQTLEITASGTKKALALEAPSSVEAGPVEITLTNEAKAPADGQLIRVDDGQSAEEAAAELKNAENSKPVADWFHAAGGVGAVEPGGTGSVTQVLEPGTYHLLGGEIRAEEPVTFEVTGEPTGELPSTDGRVTATEYAFGGDGLKAGTAQITLENTGGQWHHFLASRLKDDATMDQVKKFFESEGQDGPPPLAGRENAVESTVMDGGVSQVVDVELEKGRYVFFCFVADREGGPPHVAKGMVSEVTVD